MWWGGNEEGSSGPLPSDNFNGLTVAMSKKSDSGGGVFRQVTGLNVYTLDPLPRTVTDILAPGVQLDVAGANGTFLIPPNNSGTSFAAPHVTGTVALLQQYATQHSLGAGCGAHQVMKAVIMNSADKIIDDGTFRMTPQSDPIPRGNLLGMERTVLKKDGMSTWFNSPAYDDEPFFGGDMVPLDQEMGTGELNANRAVQQLSPGQHHADAADVPLRAWDSATRPVKVTIVITCFRSH